MEDKEFSIDLERATLNLDVGNATRERGERRRVCCCRGFKGRGKTWDSLNLRLGRLAMLSLGCATSTMLKGERA